MKKLLIVATGVAAFVSMIVAVINYQMIRNINKKLYRIKEGPRGLPGPKGDRGESAWEADYSLMIEPIGGEQILTLIIDGVKKCEVKLPNEKITYPTTSMH